MPCAGATKDMGKMLGGEEEKDPDAQKKEEERQEALRQQEEERKAKHARMEAEREKVRQQIRDKVGHLPAIFQLISLSLRSWGSGLEEMARKGSRVRRLSFRKLKKWLFLIRMAKTWLLFLKYKTQFWGATQSNLNYLRYALITQKKL